MPTARDTPYSAFNFLVQLGENDPRDVSAGFSEVSGLNTEMTVAEYRSGNDPVNHTHKYPGVYKSGDVTLKRGLMGLNDIYTWLDALRSGDRSQWKRNVTIKLQDESHSEVATWKLIGAMPLKWTGPTLTGKGGGDVAMEELVLSVEKVEYS